MQEPSAQLDTSELFVIRHRRSHLPDLWLTERGVRLTDPVVVLV